MRELKILAVVVFFTLVVYLGVEPYAHSVMHKHVESQNFAYNDVEASSARGNVENGMAAVQMHCTGCHSIESEGFAAPMDPSMAVAAYGVNPPDLSTAGLIYDEKFLAAVIKNPAEAMMVDHKFNMNNPHPMPAYNWMSDQEIVDMVAYLRHIAPSSITAEEAYLDACARCHNMRYMNMTLFGSKPEFGSKQDELKFDIALADYNDALKAYMGKVPPDLSMMLGSRGEHRIFTFIEDPQAYLAGTSMPRVGITKETAELVVEYMEKSSDPAKEQRNAIAPWVLGFLLIFTVISYFWKKSMWKDLH